MITRGYCSAKVSNCSNWLCLQTRGLWQSVGKRLHLQIDPTKMAYQEMLEVMKGIQEISRAKTFKKPVACIKMASDTAQLEALRDAEMPCSHSVRRAKRATSELPQSLLQEQCGSTHQRKICDTEPTPYGFLGLKGSNLFISDEHDFTPIKPAHSRFLGLAGQTCPVNMDLWRTCRLMSQARRQCPVLPPERGSTRRPRLWHFKPTQ